jgi:YVTN family beta-propeller protein
MIIVGGEVRSDDSQGDVTMGTTDTRPSERSGPSRRARRAAVLVLLVAALLTNLFMTTGHPAAAFPCVECAGHPTAYVTNADSNTVTPIDTTTNTPGQPILVGTNPLGIAITPTGFLAYVANSGSGTVTPILTATNTPETPLAVGPRPVSLAISPDGGTVYVAVQGNNTVVPIIRTTNLNNRDTVGTPIHLAATPSDLVVTPDGQTVYAVSYSGGTVTPITVATGMVGTPIKVGSRPTGIAVTPDGREVLVASKSTNSVVPIPTATKIPGASIPVGPIPEAIAISPNGTMAYIGNVGDGTVTPINLATAVAGAPIPVTNFPTSLSLTPDGKTLYAASLSNNTVTPVDTATNKPGSPIGVGVAPDGIAITPDVAPVAGFTSQYAPASVGLPATFDATTSTPQTSLISSYRWTFGDGHAATTTSPKVSHVYATAGTYPVTVTLTDTAGTSLTQVFTGHTVSRQGSPLASTTGTIRIYATPPGAPTLLYRPDFGGSTLTPFDTATNTQLSSISVAGRPGSVAISPDRRTAWVTSSLTNTVTPIDLATGAIIARISLSMPNAIAITTDGKTVYVATGGNTVTPISTATHLAGKSISLSGPAGALAITPNGKTLYVANPSGGTITPIATATNTALTAINVGGTPHAIVVTPDGQTLFVTNDNPDTVTPIATATNTLEAPIHEGIGAAAEAITPDGKTLYVTDTVSNTVTPIDIATRALGTPIPVTGAYPNVIAISPDGRTAYVNSFAGLTPIQLVTDTALAPVGTPQPTFEMAITPDLAPVASFTFNAAAHGSATAFNASATVARSSPVATYAWNFGDGHSATTVVPTTSHVYATAGTYKVTLTVTDAAGTSTSIVYTGQSVSRAGAPTAVASHTVAVL